MELVLSNKCVPYVIQYKCSDDDKVYEHKGYGDKINSWNITALTSNGNIIMHIYQTNHNHTEHIKEFFLPTQEQIETRANISILLVFILVIIMGILVACNLWIVGLFVVGIAAVFVWLTNKT